MATPTPTTAPTRGHSHSHSHSTTNLPPSSTAATKSAYRSSVDTSNPPPSAGGRWPRTPSGVRPASEMLNPNSAAGYGNNLGAGLGAGLNQPGNNAGGAAFASSPESECHVASSSSFFVWRGCMRNEEAGERAGTDSTTLFRSYLVSFSSCPLSGSPLPAEGKSHDPLVTSSPVPCAHPPLFAQPSTAGSKTSNTTSRRSKKWRRPPSTPTSRKSYPRSSSGSGSFRKRRGPRHCTRCCRVARRSR